MRFGSAYLLTNTVTGDTYIGVTTQTVARRWSEHRHKANGASCRTWLHRAIRKYGADKFEVLELASSVSRENLLLTEITLIKDRSPSYNQSHGGEGTTGRKFTPEVLTTRNEKLRGRAKNPEERQRISLGCRAAMTKERKNKLADTLALARGMVDEAKRIEAVRRSATERVWTKASREKLSASCMGRRHPAGVVERIRLANMKPVVCVTSGVLYANAKAAAADLKISPTSVLRVLKGKYPSVKNLTFIYGV
jgi:group I intron endonuclease